MSRVRILLAAVCLLAAGVVASPAAALTLASSTSTPTPTPTPALPKTPVPFPAQPVGLQPTVPLPAQIDPRPPYEPQTECDPVAKVGTLKLRDLLIARYGSYRVGTVRLCNEGISEHADGRALDWMVDSRQDASRAAAADFLAWATAGSGVNARRLGIMYLIYNNMIWASYRPQDGWRSSNLGHLDHVHISLTWNGARGNVSWWTGQIAPIDYGPCRRFAGQPAIVSVNPRLKPCYAAKPLVKKYPQFVAQMGQSSAAVSSAQAWLGVPLTGVVDVATRAALLAWQDTHELPKTGALDVPTWASLDPAGVTADVCAGWDSARASRYGHRYVKSTLRGGDAGKAVEALQIALDLPENMRTGFFGPVTTREVKRIQTDLGIKADGVARRALWDYLVDTERATMTP